MDRLKFWSRAKRPSEEPAAQSPKRFDVQPRTDVGSHGLPADAERASRLLALRRRRESILLEVATADEAAGNENRWRAERQLLEQAISEIDADLAAVDQSPDKPGTPLPAIPITDVTIETEPVARVRFRVGNESFSYAEEIDWAERGFQVARSELHRETGQIASLIPADYLAADLDALTEHLEASLFVFASDLRDRFLEQQPRPEATLSELARPSLEHGGWLDWLGQSSIHRARERERNRLLDERRRLSAERDHLLSEQEKLAEQLPFARRRLAEVDREIDAVSSGN